jgi:NAD/NADP transhydrogenase alpha subunit
MEMIDPFVFRLSIFVLAIFVGYFVVWGVTPALHTPLSKPDAVVEAHGVTIMGHTNLPGALSADASSLYARNLFNFISLIVDKKTGALNVDWNDEIVKGSAVTKDGQTVTRG